METCQSIESRANNHAEAREVTAQQAAESVDVSNPEMIELIKLKDDSTQNYDDG